jgi:hypothetical protein
VVEIAFADSPDVVVADAGDIGVERRLGDADRAQRPLNGRDVAPGDPDGRRRGLGAAECAAPRSAAARKTKGRGVTMTPRPYQTGLRPRRRARPPMGLEDQPEPELQEALEVVLSGRVAIDAAEVVRAGVPIVLR